ncbi:hypothetical protein KAR91_01635 [Candidatus Pacearchaeota archaeon]|nr:hypothetical protein [Candidatus Pacearchaeota archaeon]
MSNFTNYWCNGIMKHIFGIKSYRRPTIYVGLLTKKHWSSVEPVGNNGYARIRTFVKDWNVELDGIVHNARDLKFASPTKSWGKITGFALFDAATGGNELVRGILVKPERVGCQEIVSFVVGDLHICL